MILLQVSVISMSWCNLNGRWRSHETWKTIYLLFLGQVVSFVLALGSFTSSLIADLGNLQKPIFSFMHFSASHVDDHDFFFFFGNLCWPFTWFCFLLLCVGVDAPLTQTLFPYLFLASVYGSILLYRRKRLLVNSFFLHSFALYIALAAQPSSVETETISWSAFGCNILSCIWVSKNVWVWQVSWYWYLLLGFVDVQGNYLGE